MIKYYLYKFAQFLVTHLPLNVSYKIVQCISDLQFLVSTKDRNAVRNNLKNILPPEADLDKNAREVFRNFGRYLVEFFRVGPKIDQQFLKDHVTLVNQQYLDEVVAYGKGGIIFSGHIGNWELGGIVMGMLGYSIAVIALPHKEPKVNELFNHQRECKGVMVIPSVSAVRKSLKALKDNYLLAVVGDRDFSNHGFAMDFLGRKTNLPKGGAVFSFKTGAPVLPTFMLRDGKDSFKLCFEKPIYPPKITDEVISDDDLRAYMRQCISYVEDYVRRYPDQWLVMREFWIK